MVSRGEWSQLESPDPLAVAPFSPTRLAVCQGKRVHVWVRADVRPLTSPADSSLRTLRSESLARGSLTPFVPTRAENAPSRTANTQPTTIDELSRPIGGTETLKRRADQSARSD